MTGWEPARRALYNRLEEVLSGENAETLMSFLPPQPTSDPATRSDVDRLSVEMHAGFADLNRALREQQTTYSKLTIGAMTALTAIFSLIVGLIT